MRFIRTLLLVIAGTLFLAPYQAIAATKKVIIGFHRAPSADEKNLVYRTKGRIKRTHRQINAISAELPEEEIARLKGDPSVAYVVDNIKFRRIQPAQPLSVPSPEYVDSWGSLRVGAAVAAERGFKGAGVKIAIIDSGIDYNHPDLKDNYRGGFNFVENNADPYDDDEISHGTHVAGVIAARNNGTGVVGVAPEASLYAIKVFGANNTGGDMETIVAGIEWAIENRMDVINLSIGYSGDIYAVYPDIFRPLKDVCEKAQQSGIVLVAAAGNEDREIVSVPAAFDSVIAISATNETDQRALFLPPYASSFGAKVELAAPGTNIKSTVRGGGYALLSGTSQAAPHVAGAVAVLLSSGVADTNGNGSRADEVRERLAVTAKDLGALGRDLYFGWGLVDLAAATAPVEMYQLHLQRTGGNANGDIEQVKLHQGVYLVAIKNNGLRKVSGRFLDGSRWDCDVAFAYSFARGKAQDIRFELSIAVPETVLEIVPQGLMGTSADVTLTKITR